MKIIKQFLLVFLLLASVTLRIYAGENGKISEQEKRIVTEFMLLNNYKDNFEIELLYDAESVPTYLLAYSDSGYSIFYRDNMQFVERGDVNPYRNYLDYKKYYTGACEYSIWNNGFYSITHNKKIDNLQEDNEFKKQISRMGRVSEYASLSVTYTGTLSNCYSYIQRAAFGFNEEGTCTAIATTIALNYMDKTNGNIVPTGYELETLNNGKATKNNIDTKYSKAESFHQFLVGTCHMGVATFANGVNTGVRNYRNSSSTIYNTGISCSYALATSSSVKSSIQANKPSMISTSSAPEPYGYHSMVVYGCKEYSNGSKEYLVHTGWYSSLVSVSGSSTNYYMPTIWLNSGVATYDYIFTTY